MIRHKVALLGFGTVGTGVWKLLQCRERAFEERNGFKIEISKILVRNPEKSRYQTVPRHLLTSQFEDILKDPEIKVVVELIGGIDPAKAYIEQALSHGKHVVTANKALMAHHGEALRQMAGSNGVSLSYEASVCGGLPIVQTLRDGLAGEHILSLEGVLNGTTNYILSRMTHGGLSYEQALGEAQEKGFAEQNPSADVEGFDAVHKLRILTRLAYGVDIPEGVVHREGIQNIGPSDIAYAKSEGFKIKLLAVSKRVKDGFEVRVGPALIRQEHPLVNVEESFNGVNIVGDATGLITLTGKGAGGLPTGSAVVTDLVRILTAQTFFGEAVQAHNGGRTLKSGNVVSLPAAWYVRLQFLKSKGLMNKVLRTLEEQGIDIRDLKDEEAGLDELTLHLRTAPVDKVSVEQAVKILEQVTGSLVSSQLIRIESTAEKSDGTSKRGVA